MTAWDDTDDLFNRIARDVADRNRGVVEAEDVKQELWVYWLSHDKPSLDGWASYRTLVTVAERYARSERRAKYGAEPTYSLSELEALVELIVNPPSDRSAVDASGADVGEVMTALSSLPDELRKPLCAKAEGATYRELADALEVPVSTAFRRVQEALRNLAESLNGVPSVQH